MMNALCLFMPVPALNIHGVFFLERILVKVEYKEKRKRQCVAPDKMLLFRVEIIVIASSVTALGWLKKEEEEERRKSNFQPILTCSSLIINLFGKRCLACLKL